MSGYYEVHCHILPGVDDGARNMDETIRMLKAYYADGVRTIYATSHYRKRMFEPSMEKIISQYNQVKKKAREIGEGITVYLGCEFHANMDMVEILDAGERPVMGNSRCVLTEFSSASELSFIRERCYALLSHGYEPIIAHAERYPVLTRNPQTIGDLVDMGAYIQVNAESVMGDEGFSTKRFCRKLMKMDLIHFIGSDAHDSKERRPQIGRCAEYLEKKMGREYVEKILIRNPQNLIEGKR